MKLHCLRHWPHFGLVAAGLLTTTAVGCQSTIGGQTLPSAYYLEDDVQYFPPGPEFLLPNTARALEEYRLEQAGVGPGPGGGPGPGPGQGPGPGIGPGPGAGPGP